jgi:hypothetical protein
MLKVLGMGAMATARIGSRVAAVAGREGIEGIGIAARAGAEGIGMAAKGGGKALGMAVRGAGKIHMPTLGASGSDENRKKHWWSLSANIADNESVESAENAENETRDASVSAESETQDASDEDIDPLDGFKNHLSQDSGDNDLLDQIFLKAQPHLGLEPYQANVVDERLRRSIRA